MNASLVVWKVVNLEKLQFETSSLSDLEDGGSITDEGELGTEGNKSPYASEEVIFLLNHISKSQKQEQMIEHNGQS